MVSLKYAKEYRLDTFTDERGKVKDCTVYIGPLYEWTSTEAQLRKYAILLTIMTLVQSLLLVFSLWNYSDLSRLWWVAVPYSCLLFVFLYMGTVCYHLFVVKGRFHREQKDKTVNRFKACSVVGMIFSSITAIAVIVSLSFEFAQMEIWNGALIIADLVIFLLFICECGMSKNLHVKEVMNPEADKWKDK